MTLAFAPRTQASLFWPKPADPRLRGGRYPSQCHPVTLEATLLDVRGSGPARSCMDLVRTALPHGPLWEGASVLVVDDEAPIRTLVRRTLQLQGFTVEEAADSQSALALVEAREGQFDLVLTDLQMPGINGRQLAEVISLYQPGIAVVGMSANPAGVPLIDGSHADLPFLWKPFTAAELYDAVRSTLSHTANLMALAKSEIARARAGVSSLAAGLEASRLTRKQMLDLVAAARELRKEER